MTLPGLFCQAANGSLTEVQSVVETWQLIYTGLYFQDKLTDGQTLSGLSTGEALNVITGLITAAAYRLATSNTLPDDIAKRFHQTILIMCDGQHKSLQQTFFSLDESLHIARQRSGVFFETGAWSGVRCVTANPEQTRAAAQIGHHLGMMIQINNDVGGLWTTGTSPGDLSLLHYRSLPLAYTMSVLSDPQRSTLIQHLEAARTNAEAEAEARRIIIESGSLVYLSVELESHHQQIQKHLTVFPVTEASKAIQNMADTRRYITDK